MAPGVAGVHAAWAVLCEIEEEVAAGTLARIWAGEATSTPNVDVGGEQSLVVIPGPRLTIHGSGRVVQGRNYGCRGCIWEERGGCSVGVDAGRPSWLEVCEEGSTSREAPAPIWHARCERAMIRGKASPTSVVVGLSLMKRCATEGLMPVSTEGQNLDCLFANERWARPAWRRPWLALAAAVLSVREATRESGKRRAEGLSKGGSGRIVRRGVVCACLIDAATAWWLVSSGRVGLLPDSRAPERPKISLPGGMAGWREMRRTTRGSVRQGTRRVVVQHTRDGVCQVSGRGVKHGTAGGMEDGARWCGPRPCNLGAARPGGVGFGHFSRRGVGGRASSDHHSSNPSPPPAAVAALNGQGATLTGNQKR